MLDVSVIATNFRFLIVQGFLGIGGFAGGTLRLAVPAIALGFLLGIFVGLARLAPARWVRLPATVYVDFFRTPLSEVASSQPSLRRQPSSLLPSSETAWASVAGMADDR